MSPDTSNTSTGVAEDVAPGMRLRVVRARGKGEFAAAIVGMVLLACVMRSVVANRNFGWPVVGHYLFSPFILQGLATTILLTIAVMVIGICLGLALALLRVRGGRIVVLFYGVYVWFFRGTPQLVQLLFWYNLAALYPRYHFGIPFLAPDLFAGSTNELIGPLSAALLGLGLNEGAYMAEIVRAGLEAVDAGQVEAARAIGMTSSQVLRRVVVPQAMRFIVPPTANQVIGMLKTTSIVSTIAVGELLYSAQIIYSRTFQTIQLLIVACFWYLVATSVLTALQYAIEKAYSPGSRQRR